jgi:hypothetical protein
MTWTNAGLVAVLLVTGYLAYKNGFSAGVSAAPEYVAHEKELFRQWDRERAADESEYEGSPQQVCDQIFDLVWEHQTDLLAKEHFEEGQAQQD